MMMVTYEVLVLFIDFKCWNRIIELGLFIISPGNIKFLTGVIYIYIYSTKLY